MLPELNTIGDAIRIWYNKICYLNWIQVKVLMKIVLDRLSLFYQNHIVMTLFGFRSANRCNNDILQLRQIAYLSKRKWCPCYFDLTAEYNPINRNFPFSSIRNHFWSSHATKYLDLAEERYRFIKSYMSDGNPNTETFQIPSGLQPGRNKCPSLSNLFSRQWSAYIQV